GDMVARLGGEEFLVTMPDTGHVAAATAADRLRRVVAAEEIPLPGRTGGLVATVSIGVAVAQPGADPEPTAAEIVDHADRALLAAKAEGRNQVSLARPAA
ncbi:MAG: GGDEF domain-containing protein, partial [Rhodobacteraceae bacterium]|nr:GGDEF domain-containing protein [Paracoccaceae bacterium]